MYKYLILVFLVVGCKVNFDKPDPVKPDPVVVIEDFNTTQLSAALCRLAERCAKSDIRKATSELDGTLNELVSDGVSNTYTDSVRAAVPAIGKKPPRDLTAEEIVTLRGVK